MKKNCLILLPVLIMFTSINASAGTWVKTYPGAADSGGMIGTITFDDWGFVGPGGRLADEFDNRNGFGNGTYDSLGASYCIANPSDCDIGQVQHVVTSGPDGLTPDLPAFIKGDVNIGGPYENANVDSTTTFYHWGYTTVAGSTFNNMLIDLDGDYRIAQGDMQFEFYNVLDYEQVIPAGSSRVGSIADGQYINKLGFQPYALTDAKGWCGSITASHPNAHEAMAGQVTFDVAFDVYYVAGSFYSYMSTEVIRFFEMRSYGDLYIDFVNPVDPNGAQMMSSRAVVNNTDPRVSNQSVGPSTPVGDLSWHNKVSFMGGSIIEDGTTCGIETPAWKSGARGPGVTRFASILPGGTDASACTAAGGTMSYNAFPGRAFILRADGGRFIDYFDASVYGPDPMTVDSDSDSVLDFMDNCSMVVNDSQQDTDNDGYGNACDADFNGDNYVNSLDIGLFKGMFFATGDSMADLNGDALVNSQDLGLFKALFFQAPGPSGIAP